MDAKGDEEIAKMMWDCIEYMYVFLEIIFIMITFWPCEYPQIKIRLGLPLVTLRISGTTDLNPDPSI